MESTERGVKHDDVIHVKEESHFGERNKEDCVDCGGENTLQDNFEKAVLIVMDGVKTDKNLMVRKQQESISG